MSDLISRSALIKDFEIQRLIKENRLFTIPQINALIKNAPTVDAVPVVHAKWIAQNDALTRFMCSNCKSENHEGFETYCPKCGAKMDLR